MTIEHTIRELYIQLAVQYEANPLVKMRVDIKARENNMISTEAAIYLIASDYAGGFYACQEWYASKNFIEPEIPQK